MNIKSIWVLVIFLIANIAMAQELPTVQELNVDGTLGEINTTMETIPDALDDEIIPNETATQLFSYMKWMFSDTAANELLGQTLAPIGLELYALLVIAITFTLMWLTIRMLVLSWRLLLFIVGWIIKLVELIPIFQ